MSFARLALLCLVPLVVFGQASTGTPGDIEHFEGAVFVKDVALTADAEEPAMGRQGTLRTEAGKAEVLFALGSLMRVDVESELELVSAGFSSATYRLHKGAVIIQAFNAWDGDSLHVEVGDAVVTITSAGESRIEFDGTTGQVLVRSGHASVALAGEDYRVKKKQSARIASDGVTTSKVKGFPEDALTAWYEQRVKDVLAATPKDQRRKKSKRGYDYDGSKPFGAGELPDRAASGL